MTVRTAVLAARRLCDDGLADSQLSVVWHAGEPLAMPISFYDEAIEGIAAELGPGRAATHAIQTNAMLIDHDWCAFFRRRNVRVGVSIDGPADLHDAHRVTRRGRGTHSRAMRGIEYLREAGIPFHAIAVITADTLVRVEEFVSFFIGLGVTELGCNFDEAEGSHRHSSIDGHETAHRQFLATLFDHPMVASGKLRVRELSHSLRLVSTPLPRIQWRNEVQPDNLQVRPFTIISVAWNGDFSTFSPELLGQPSEEFRNFVLGNVGDDGYLASGKREPFLSMWSQVRAGVKSCGKACAHFEHCGGGSPANKLYENNDIASGETLYCRAMVKVPFDLALERAERLAGVA